MKRRGKKFLTILLSVMIVVTYMVPGSVFAETTRAAGDLYELVDSLEDGGEYLIVNTNSAGTAYALTNSGSSSLDKTEVTISDDLKISAPSEAVIWTAATNGEGFNLSNGGSYMEGAGGEVTIVTSLQYSTRYFTYENNQLAHVGGRNTYVVYYDGSKYTSTYNSTNEKVYIYKKAAAGTASVTGVTLDQTSLTLKQGKTATLKATVAPTDAADKTVSWATSDDTVATVSNGKVTAEGPGTAIITVTTNDGDFTAQCAVTVQAAELETYVLVDEPVYGESYLIVSSNSAGSAYALTNPGGTSGGAAMAATPVTITEKNGSPTISADKDDTSILWKTTKNGEGFTLTNGSDYIESSGGKIAIFNPVKNADRYWKYEDNVLSHGGGSSSNWYILYYDNGFAYTYNGAGGKVYFFGVPGTASVTGVTLDQATMNLKEGKTATLTATVAPADAANKAVSWSTSNADVATVDNGTVTATGAGTATITVTTEEGGFTATCTVTVEEAQLDTYKLVDGPTSGKTYLIVNTNVAGTGYALTNPGGTSNGASMGATPVTVVNKTRAAGDVAITVESDETDVVWTATSNNGRFNLTNGTDYLEGKSGDVKIFTEQQYDDRGWTYTDNQLKHEGGNNTYILYYDDGYKATYNSNSGKVYFFEKDAGGDDPGTDPIPVESITLNKTEASVKVGSTVTLTATVLPANADDPTVTWTTANASVATVSDGIVTGVAEGTTTITAQAGENTATCAVTVTKEAVTGETVYVGVTSDVHGSVDRLRSWLTAVQAEYEPDLDSMLYCGDYSYQMNNLNSYLSEFNAIVTATNELVGEGKAVYTSGNHEYYINGTQTTLNTTFTSTPGWVTVGPALEKSNYIVFCMGACEWDANGNYPESDINTLRDFLDSAPTDIPIIIPAHFPLHTNSTRATVNADLMIDLLNEHPNVIMLWGHNHSQSDTHYGQVKVAGDTIEYASGKTKEINFTYACAGGMYQDSQTRYSGLVMTISGSGDTVTFKYYNADGSSIGESTTIHIDGTPLQKYTITASAGEGGTITPSGNIEVTEGKNKEFTFKADTGYKVDTLTVDGETVQDPGKSYTFTNVSANHTINVTFKAKDPGEGNYYKLVNALKNGEEYLIVSTNATGRGYALTNPGATSSGGVSPTATEVTVEEGDVDNDGTDDKFISIDQENVVWLATTSSGGFDLTNDGAYIEGSGGNINIFKSKQNASRGWSYSDNYLHHTGGSYSYELYYNNGFTSRMFNSGGGTNKVYIYEKTEYVQGSDPVESVTLDKSEITLIEGKTDTLKATVLPKSAQDKSVTWTTSDDTVATVSQTGVVTAVKEGTATITVTSNSDNTKKATCTVTVEPYVPGSGINVGVTSDVHGNIDGLTSLLQVIQDDYDPDMDSMLYCGDYSYVTNNTANYLADFNEVIDVTNTIIGQGKGVYTSGNHEYYTNGEQSTLNSGFTSAEGFTRIGEALNKDDYIVYCMGAVGWCNANGEYPQADIDALATYLETAPTDIPILIPAHFPLHANSSRATTNADKMIDLLNNYPNVIFFWGHNHSQSDPHYGQVVKAGGSIEYASGSSKEINFTYACAGGMYQDSQTNFSAVVVHIEKVGQGYDVSFQYYRAATGEKIGEETTVHVEGTESVTHTITASAGANGTITPSGAVSVREGANKAFTFNPASGYEVDTVTVDGTAVEVTSESYTFTNVTADHTIAVTFKKADYTEYVLTDVANNNGRYLVVSNGYALINDNGVIGAVPVQVTDEGSVLVRNSDLAKDIFWTLKTSTTTEQSGAFTVENNGMKLARVSGGESGGASMPAEITAEENYSTYSGFPYFQWSYSVDDTMLTMLGGQEGTSTFYFYYNTSEGKFYTNTEAANTGLYIPASPETVWSDPTYTWAEDHSTCTASRTGTTGSSTVEDKETVEATVVTVAATCETPGSKTYTAEFTSTYFETQTYEETIDALNHDWGEVTYVWAADNSSVTATRVCGNDASHTETETVATVAEITKPATCEEKGETTYTATFKNEAFGQKTKTVENINALGHDWGEPEYVWADDNSSVTATRVCGNDPTHVETETAQTVAEVTKPATCEAKGETTYTATFKNTAFVQKTKTVENINALGHDWGEVEYTWADDYSSVTATRVCGNDPTHVETETAQTTAEVTKPATCDTKGETTYTSAAFNNKAFKVQTRTVENINALGHDWGEVEYTWAEDYSTVTAKRVCANDETHVDSETVVTKATVTKPATCEEKGETTYVATFNNEAFVQQTKTVKNIDKLGHDYRFTDFEWAEDYSAASAVFVCRNDSEHVQKVGASITNIVVAEPTCETNGSVIYTATVSKEQSLDDVEHTDIGSAQIPATGHTYESQGWTWASDYSKATLSFKCKVCGDIVQIDGKIESDVTEPTCTETGRAIYTATAEFEGKSYTYTNNITTPALGHDWDEPVWTWTGNDTDGYTAAEATFTCKRVPEHTQTIEANITDEEIVADCVNEGRIGYTAIVEFEGREYKDTKGKVTPALGHSWGEPTYEWVADHNSVTATRVCAKDPTHIETETVQTEAEITEQPTCDSKGQTTYTATFKNPAFAKQTKTFANIEPLGHDWEFVDIKWTGSDANGYTEAVANYKCTRDPGHRDSVSMELVRTSTDATCTEAGTVTYTASISKEAALDGTPRTDVKTVTGQALGHSWGDPTYEWTADNSKVTAKRVCANDPTHVETETVETVAEVTKPATCEAKGETTYTATFENKAFSKQEKTVANVDALGHSWGEPTYEWAADNSKVTATRVCANDKTHVETETAETVARVTKPATCETKGETTYTAIFVNKAFSKQEKTVENIEATEHSWGEPTYEWAADNSTVTAKRVCKLNPEHVDTETVETTAKTTAATCTKDGKVVYTATFKGEAFAKQTKTEVLPKTGHSYGEYQLTTKATTSVSGKLTKTCEHCGKEVIMKVAPMVAKVTVLSDSEVKVNWVKVEGAQRYLVYFNHCGKSNTKKIGTTSNRTFTWAGLTKGNPYKFKILAQRKIDGKWKTISTGFLTHFVAGDLSRKGKYSNAKSITVDNSTVTIKAGKTKTITATAKPVKSGKEIFAKGHAPLFRYLSADTDIAKVSSNGKITGISKGKCKVYVIAPNGVYKAISVTVN